jgi:hypothetical protein
MNHIGLMHKETYCVGFQILTAASMNIMDGLLEYTAVSSRFRGAYCLHHQVDNSLSDGGSSTYVWNVGLL